MSPTAAGGFSIERVALGTMNFGKRTDEATSARIIHRAIERGVSMVDTANVYNDGESERIVGRAIRARRSDVRLATKVGLARSGRNAEGLSPARIEAAIDESLARLGTDHVDLYYAHAPDEGTPRSESTRAMARVVASGKATTWGMSNHASWQVLEARVTCEREGLSPPAVSQVIYNMLVRQIEIEHLAFARAHSVHVTVYNALAGGLLSDRYAHVESDAPPTKGTRFDKNPMYQRRYWTARFFALVAELHAIAAEAGVSLATFAYGWLAARTGVSSVLIGPADVAQLDTALDALAAPLDPSAIARADSLYVEFQGTDATYAR